MAFLNPLDGADSQNPIFTSQFWVRVTSGAQGSVSVGFGGARKKN